MPDFAVAFGERGTGRGAVEPRQDQRSVVERRREVQARAGAADDPFGRRPGDGRSEAEGAEGDAPRRARRRSTERRRAGNDGVHLRDADGEVGRAPFDRCVEGAAEDRALPRHRQFGRAGERPLREPREDREVPGRDARPPLDREVAVGDVERAGACERIGFAGRSNRSMRSGASGPLHLDPARHAFAQRRPGGRIAEVERFGREVERDGEAARGDRAAAVEEKLLGREAGSVQARNPEVSVPCVARGGVEIGRERDAVDPCLLAGDRQEDRRAVLRRDPAFEREGAGLAARPQRQRAVERDRPRASAKVSRSSAPSAPRVPATSSAMSLPKNSCVVGREERRDVARELGPERARRVGREPLAADGERAGEARLARRGEAETASKSDSGP
jgi:hypothetical protein